MKDYSDMTAKEKVLHQFKRRMCEDISVMYTDMSLDYLVEEGDQSEVEEMMRSVGEAFFQVMQKESLQDLRHYMIECQGWDYDTFDDAFFTFMSK